MSTPDLPADALEDAFCRLTRPEDAERLQRIPGWRLP